VVIRTAPEAPPAEIEAAIWSALEGVPDPEIPAVSVVEMGMIHQVDVDGDHARVVVLPTFTGCPALAIIQEDVARAASKVEGVNSVNVETSFEPPWTSDRISSVGRAKLRNFGLAPPNTGTVLIAEIGLPKVAMCPYCGSTDTVSDSLFGPTPCRAAYYCNSCRNPFEQFKQV
jgi:ring-1,2-phenylacetyl-CoA epoxidase subunit PaaD